MDKSGTGRQVQGPLFCVCKFMDQSGTAAQADKFRGYFFGFASSWTKVAQADKLKGRQCILLNYQLFVLSRIYHLFVVQCDQIRHCCNVWIIDAPI